jgi:hypothetical protein
MNLPVVHSEPLFSCSFYLWETMLQRASILYYVLFTLIGSLWARVTSPFPYIFPCMRKSKISWRDAGQNAYVQDSYQNPVHDKTLRTYRLLYCLPKGVKFSANAGFSFYKALIQSIITYACPAWLEVALMSLQNLPLLWNSSSMNWIIEYDL